MNKRFEKEIDRFEVESDTGEQEVASVRQEFIEPPYLTETGCIPGAKEVVIGGNMRAHFINDTTLQRFDGKIYYKKVPQYED